jgi:hypothetical protein
MSSVKLNSYTRKVSQKKRGRPKKTYENTWMKQHL